MFIKLMGGPPPGDFTMIECSSVTFATGDKAGSPGIAVVERMDGTEQRIEVRGRAYILNDRGDTIQTFASPPATR